MTMKMKYDFAVQEVADKFVGVARNPETQAVERVFRLNETGTLILRALQDGSDAPAIVARLLQEYDVTREEAEAEVNAFIDMLSNL